MISEISAAIIGASGYTGLELLRILKCHPHVKVTAITSRQYCGKSIAEVLPSLRGFYEGLYFSDPSGPEAAGAAVVFSCLPHAASMEVVRGFVEAGKKVIDLSADFRLKDAGVYEKWYGEHTCSELLGQAVYGLPEINREAIKGARLIANPGCYPTGATLAVAPILKAGLMDKKSALIIDSKSGVSGAGRGLSEATSFVQVTGGFNAYKVGGHRHTPEIEQNLSGLAGEGVEVVFTPHLLPVSRGILTTLYAKLSKGLTTTELHGLYKEAYEGEPFVRLLPEGQFPNISEVRSSNYCDIGLWSDPASKQMIAISAIDNLVKGASGQAVQNMNLVFGLAETTGLILPPQGI
ncbi:MAG: N-acetyl-gamma-glutamyl-phosphate reductase [Thermodesulfobacteriota bacterium]